VDVIILQTYMITMHRIDLLNTAHSQVVSWNYERVRQRISAEPNISSAFPLLFSLYFKLMNIFKKTRKILSLKCAFPPFTQHTLQIFSVSL
jgi:hypothetical protein